MSHKLFLLPVILFFAAITCANLAFADNPKAELKDLRQRIKALQTQLESTESSKTEIADALKQSERAISETNRRLYHLLQQQRGVDETISKLRLQAEELESSVQGQQAALSRLFYGRYINGVSEPLKLLLNGQDPNQVVRQIQYYRYISDARIQEIDRFRHNLAQLKELAEQEQVKRTELTKIQAEQNQEKTKLEKEKAERQQVLAKVSQQIQQQRKQISTLKRDEDRLTKLVERINKMLAQRKPSKKAPREAVAPAPQADIRALQPPKGTLHLPVQGSLQNRYGSPRAESGVTWKGLFITAKLGEEVKAMADGRVVFADWLRGFGNLLIIDHGQGLMSLYGNNETLYKQVGDQLRAGDTIAAVGNSGGNPESGLYFELRYQGKPFDPLKWLKWK